MSLFSKFVSIPSVMNPTIKFKNGDWRCTLSGFKPMVGKTPFEAYKAWAKYRAGIERGGLISPSISYPISEQPMDSGEFSALTRKEPDDLSEANWRDELENACRAAERSRVNMFKGW